MRQFPITVFILSLAMILFGADCDCGDGPRDPDCLIDEDCEGTPCPNGDVPVCLSDFCDCEPSGGTGGAGGSAGTGGSAGSGGAGGTGGAGGMTSQCTETNIDGQAQITGNIEAGPATVSPGGIVTYAVPVDDETHQVVATLLPFDLIVMAPPGMDQQDTDGGELVEGMITVPGNTPAGDYFIDAQLFLEPNNPQNSTFYTQTQEGDPEEWYVRGVLEDDVFLGEEKTDCLITVIRVE